MYRYNWTSIKKHSKKDIKKILKYFSVILLNTSSTEAYLYKEKWAINVLKESQLPGMSFIENLQGLLDNNMNGTEAELYIYIDLISKRDCFSYLNTKKKMNYLPIWKAEHNYDIDKLKMNRLLYIDDTNIYFVYEGEK